MPQTAISQAQPQPVQAVTAWSVQDTLGSNAVQQAGTVQQLGGGGQQLLVDKWPVLCDTVVECAECLSRHDGTYSLRDIGRYLQAGQVAERNALDLVRENYHTWRGKHDSVACCQRIYS